MYIYTTCQNERSKTKQTPQTKNFHRSYNFTVRHALVSVASYVSVFSLSSLYIHPPFIYTLLVVCIYSIYDIIVSYIYVDTYTSSVYIFSPAHKLVYHGVAKMWATVMFGCTYAPVCVCVRERVRARASE